MSLWNIVSLNYECRRCGHLVTREELINWKSSPPFEVELVPSEVERRAPKTIAHRCVFDHADSVTSKWGLCDLTGFNVRERKE